MKNIQKNLFILLFVIAASAHQINAQEVVTIGGKHYYIHKIENKETLYSIAKKYNVGQKELTNANPQLINGERIKNGEEIRIPIAKTIISKSQNSSDVSSNGFIIHNVKKGETAYSISKLYGVSLIDLCKWNPEIEKELKENDRVRIKSQTSNADDQKSSDTEDENYYYHIVCAGENPSALARRYNVRVQDLFTENPIIMDNLKVGTQIRIPKKSETTAKTKGYFWHEIKAGDTYYAYQKTFGASKEEIVELNNELHDNLPVGLKIKIPTAHLTPEQKSDKNLIKYDEHEVQKGETIWGLSKKYEIEIDELKEINPELKTRNMALGEIILVPRKSDAPSSAPLLYGNSNPFDNSNAEATNWISVSDTLHIELFLPLYLDKNFPDETPSETEITETTSSEETADSGNEEVEEVVKYRSIYRPSRSFIYFYEGFLLGLNTMQSNGVRAKLHVTDTQSESFANGEWQNSSSHANLIVGPVELQQQKAIAAFAAERHIPMVSPLSTSDSLTKTNHFYCQAAAPRKYILQRTADYIGETYYNKNIVYIQVAGDVDPEEKQMVAQAHEKAKSIASRHGLSTSFTEVDFSGGVAKIQETLKKDEVNVVLIPAPSIRSLREVTMSKVINALQVLAGDYQIVLVGFSDYMRLKSINTEYYHRLNFTYLTSSFVDYDDLAVNKFISDYRNEFEAEPNQFSFRGYDLAVYFCEAYSKLGKGFFYKLDSFSTDLMQVDFGFKRMNGQGYMNHVLQIIRFMPDYSVKVAAKY